MDMQLAPELDPHALNHIGGRIRAARKAAKLSVVDAARAVKISRTSLSLWESGTVKNPDGRALFEFAKLTEVSLDWLMEGTGPEPILVRPAELKSKPTKSTIPTLPVETPVPPPPTSAEETRAIPEIAANLNRHAQRIDPDAQGFWVIPHDVVQRSFNAQPGRVVMQQVITASAGVHRGDYVMIDLSRTTIDEPGIYLVADPGGQRARRAVVTAENGGSLRITLLGDDHSRDKQVTPADKITALGRVMGIFHPV